MKSKPPVPRDKAVYAREFWRTVFTLLLLMVVVGMAALVLSGVLDRPPQ